jgi:hypothetical protein
LFSLTNTFSISQPIFRIQPLNLQQQEAIVRLRFTGRYEPLQVDMMNLLMTKPKIQKIAQTPLIVSLLVSIFQRQYVTRSNSSNTLIMLQSKRRASQKIPEVMRIHTRYDMYQEALTFLLFEYAIARDDGRNQSEKMSLYKLLENRDRIWRVFEIFAYNVHKAGTKQFYDLNNLDRNCNINDEYKTENLHGLVKDLQEYFYNGQIPLFTDIGMNGKLVVSSSILSMLFQIIITNYFRFINLITCRSKNF